MAGVARKQRIWRLKHLQVFGLGGARVVRFEAEIITSIITF